MKKFLENRKENQKAIRAVSFGCFPVFIIGTLLFLFFLFNTDEINYASIIIVIIIFIILSTSFVYFTKNRNELDAIERNILRILISFMKETNINRVDAIKIISRKFKNYNLIKINDFINKYFDKEIDLYKACKKIKDVDINTTYFILYMLLDISAKDGILSIKEEKFILDITKKTNISVKTYNYIKNSYLKKGLKEEKKILEEAKKKEYKKIKKAFIPYNAYKILGVTTNITKNQLKKTYRTLAKKYHPDKFYGQNDAVIQEMEDKFQEIIKYND